MFIVQLTINFFIQTRLNYGNKQ